MKSFLTILILSSAIFALIEETPTNELTPESQKTDLIINTDSGQSIKVNTDQLSGLSHGRHSRKAHQVHGKNRKARQAHGKNRKAADADDDSSIEFDVTFFEPEDFPTEFQSEVETLQDAIVDVENACKVKSGLFCIGRATAKTVRDALLAYQDLFIEQNIDVLQEAIEEYEEIMDEGSDRKKSRKRTNRRHWVDGFKMRLIVN